MYKQGADKEARGGRDWTPLHLAAGAVGSRQEALPVLQYLCEQVARDNNGDMPKGRHYIKPQIRTWKSIHGFLGATAHRKLGLRWPIMASY